ncbi:MAG: HAMP domain-containing protein [Geobacteraceae bacterium]|nr:HAMP domain-containing protein [Geobacteraceae bacterium]
MQIGIKQRLFLAIVAASILSVISMFMVLQWSLDRGFLRYANSLEQNRLATLVETLERIYTREGSWDFLKLAPGSWHSFIAASQLDIDPGPPAPSRETDAINRPERDPDRLPLPPSMERGFANRVFLLDASKMPLIAAMEIPANAESRPLKQGKTVIGYLGLLPHKRVSDERQLRFLKELKTAFAIVAGIIVLLAAGLSLPLSTRLTKPLRALADANNRLATGDYEIRMPVTSTDELGQLARDFNSLALTLGKNELSRRQWVADISHELRTPLTILRGEIEALQDGIRLLNPAAINSLHHEAMRLTRLVDDLYQLSLSDLGALSYRKEEIDLAPMLTSILATYKHEFAVRNINFTADFSNTKKFILFADTARLLQLFGNLLDNSLQYTDPGGRAVLTMTCADDFAEISLEDSSPGVNDGDIERLFDRLYRVETSRSRNSGGAGLGLAICNRIVEAHSGSIIAEHSDMGGIRIKVSLPIAEGRG